MPSISGISTSVTTSSIVVVTVELLERLASVAGGLDAVAGGLEDAALELAHRQRVLDDEHLAGRASLAGAAAGRRAAATRSRPAPRTSASRVDEQRDPAVAEDRRAEVAWSATRAAGRALLTTTSSLPSRTSQIAATRRPDAWRTIAGARSRGRRRRGAADELGQVGERDRAAAQLERRAARERQRLADRDRLLDARERDPVDVAGALDEQHLDQRQREREPEDDFRPAPRLARAPRGCRRRTRPAS